MPKRKARKSLFSSDDARRKAVRVELERYERLRRLLRGKGELFQGVRIPKNVDIFVYEMMQ